MILLFFFYHVVGIIWASLMIRRLESYGDAMGNKTESSKMILGFFINWIFWPIWVWAAAYCYATFKESL